MAPRREKFATKVDARTLAALRRLAEREGCEIQALVAEALNGLIEKRRQGRPRARVISTYQRSHVRYGDLYKKLAQ